jgi:hypothetical protein
MESGRRFVRVRVAAAVALVAFLTIETLATGVATTHVRAAVVGDPAAPFVARESPTVAVPGRANERARFLLVEIERGLTITARPGGGRVVGTMPSGSRFYRVPTVAWVRRVSEDGRFGLVDVPYVAGHASGWIGLRGLDRSWTRVSVVADLSEHRISVLRGGAVLFRARAATGAASSPTPAGRYFVTDRVSFAQGSALGTFAFGISGIQPRLPAGWSGGDQLAIHGTNAPWSIGRSASAGCLRVSERVLDRLKPLLRLGSPVIVRP